MARKGFAKSKAPAKGQAKKSRAKGKITKAGAKGKANKKSGSAVARKGKKTGVVSYSKAKLVSQQNIVLLWNILLVAMQSADPPVALPFLRLVSELTQIPYNTLLYQWHGVENHLGHDLIPKSAAGGTLGAAQGAVGGTRVVSYSKAELVSQQNVELLWNCVLASMKSRNPEMTMPDLKLVSRKTGFPYNTLLYQWHGIENHLGQEMVGKH